MAEHSWRNLWNRQAFVAEYYWKQVEADMTYKRTGPFTGYEEAFDKAACDTSSPWLPRPPVGDTEASETRGVPDVEAHKAEALKRKQQPLYSGCFAYFPDALLAVAALSFAGNKWHNPGQPLHWDRKKSTDQHDALLRHLIGAGTIDTDGIRHSAKVAWRALAALQLEIERG